MLIRILSFYKTAQFHFLLCGLFFLLQNVNELYGQVELNKVLISALVLLSVAFLIKYILTLLTERSVHAAIFTSILMLMMLYYAYIFFFLISFPSIKAFLKEGYLIIGLLIGIVVIAWFLLKTSRQLITFNLYLNILFSIFFLFELVTFVTNLKNVERIRPQASASNNVSSKEFIETPDIYFIVADSYANSENLKKYWNYNNSNFISFLKNEGFFHIKHSKSNYDNTISSIASTLNMEFLPMELDLSSSHQPIISQNRIVDKIETNNVFQRLKLEGYEIYNLSLFKVLDKEQHYFDRFFYRNFYNHLLSKTLPIRLFVRYTFLDPHPILAELERISEQKKDKPKAVYCHLLLPHFPYVYDSTGKVRRSLNPSFKNSARYLEQLVYTNVLLTKTIKKIRTNSEGAIIILVSDHGYRQLENDADRIRESFENFSSIYFPDKDYSMLYDSMSSINIFKVVFGKLEGRKIELEKDKINHFD